MSVKRHVDRGDLVITIYWDFLKAFDIVPHQNLFNGCVIRFFNGLLKNKVEINSNFLEWRKVRNIVLQGF